MTRSKLLSAVVVLLFISIGFNSCKKEEHKQQSQRISFRSNQKNDVKKLQSLQKTSNVGISSLSSGETCTGTITFDFNFVTNGYFQLEVYQMVYTGYAAELFMEMDSDGDYGVQGLDIVYTTTGPELTYQQRSYVFAEAFNRTKTFFWIHERTDIGEFSNLTMSDTRSCSGSSGPGGGPGGGTGGDGGTGSQYYTESEMLNIINNLADPVTGDGIQLYLLANYNGSKLLNLTVFGNIGQAVTAGSYTLTPHYDNNGNLLYYAAARGGINGIEYLIKGNQLNAFINNLTYYTAAADMVYLGGVPTKSQIQLMAGDYLTGLWNMWGDSLKSPTYYMYLAHVLFGIGTNLQPANIQYTNITIRNTDTPNYQISNMTFQDYKNALSAKYGQWQATSTPGVQTLSAGSYRWTARTIADQWGAGFSIDYYKISTSTLIGKFRFTN